MIGREQVDDRFLTHSRPGLCGKLAVDPHLTGEDEGAGSLARRSEAPLDQKRVEADRLFQLWRASTHRTIAGNWPVSPSGASAASARSAQSAASRRDSSRPNKAGYVGLPAAASFPAVLPRSEDAPSTSRMSSTI